MGVEEESYKAAVNFVQKRYPTCWGGAAALRLESGQILISVAPQAINTSTELCMETGAICDAHKLGQKVTHSICVARDDDNSNFKVLTPCGICQERLFYWGSDVKAGIYSAENNLIFKTLKEIQPYHWYEAYQDEVHQ